MQSEIGIIAMDRLIILFFAIPLFFLSGCAYQNYPADWSKPEPILLPDGCVALAGIYSDKSNKIDHVSGIGFYLVHNYYSLKNTDHFELTVPKTGTLKIVTYWKDTVVAEYQFSEQDKTLKCVPT